MRREGRADAGVCILESQASLQAIAVLEFVPGAPIVPRLSLHPEQMAMRQVMPDASGSCSVCAKPLAT